jgi:hypothetical protein
MGVCAAHVPTYRSVKPMVSAFDADGRSSTPGAGQIYPPLSTHLTDVLDPGQTMMTLSLPLRH